MLNMMPTGGEGYWNSMLGGYAMSRYGGEAFEHFEQRHHGHEHQYYHFVIISPSVSGRISCLWNFQ